MTIGGSNDAVRLFRETKLPQDLLNENPLLSTRYVIHVLKGELQSALAQAFHFLHQRRAEIGKIPAQHTAQAKALSSEHTRIKGIFDRVSELWCAISDMPKAEQKAYALQAMLLADELATIYFARSTELQKLLKDKTRAADLQKFKEMIQELDALSGYTGVLYYLPGQTSNAAKLEKFIALCKQFTANPPKDNYLYNELCMYMLYVAKSLQAPQDIQRSLDVTLERPKSQKNIHELQGALKATTLLPEEEFRPQTTLKDLNYRDIADVVTPMSQVLQSVNVLERDIVDTLERAINGQTPSETALQALGVRAEDHGTLLDHWFNKLLGKAFSTQVHAGWYFEAGIHERANEVKSLFLKFKEMLEGDFAKRASAVNTLVVYLRTENSPQDAKITRLFDATVAACALPETNTPFYRAIEQLVAKEGATLLQFTPDEQMIAKKVFTRTQQWDERLETYLMKGLLYNLHFKAAFEQDYEFEATLFMLKSDPFYQKAFTGYLERSEVFRRLHDAYMQQHERLQASQEMQTVLSLLTRLHRPRLEETSENADKHETAIRVYTLEHELEGLPVGDHKNWLFGVVQAFKEQNAAKLDFTDAAHSDPLYKQLKISLFPTPQNDVAAADKAIIELLSQKDFDIRSVEGIVKTMLYRWRIAKFLETDELSMEAVSLGSVARLGVNWVKGVQDIHITQVLLDDFINEFLTLPKAQSFWRCQYDVGFLEILLRKYFKVINDQEFFIAKRGKGFALWHNIVAHYSDFRMHAPSPGRLVPNSRAHKIASKRYEAAKAMYDEAYKLETPPEGENHIQIAYTLLCEMREFLAGERAGFIQSL